MRANRGHLLALITFAALALGGAEAAAQAESGAEGLSIARGSVKGARGLAKGQVAVAFGGGLTFAFPYGLANVAVGTGWGLSLEAEAESFALGGYSYGGRVVWGSEGGEGWAFGGSAFVQRASLSAINQLFGIEWQNFALGNDFIAGGELAFTFLRAAGADITLAAGASATLGGPRYTGFSEFELQFDPGFRNVFASIAGEWELTEHANLFITFEALFPFHTEIRPLGYLPTASSGVVWTW